MPAKPAIGTITKIYSCKNWWNFFGKMAYLFCGPVEDGRPPSNLVVLLDDGGGPPLGDEGSQLGLPRQLDDVPVQEEPGQKVLHLVSLLGAAHVQHQDTGLGLLLASGLFWGRLGCRALKAGIPDA